jgi:hypothetical protein
MPHKTKLIIGIISALATITIDGYATYNELYKCQFPNPECKISSTKGNFKLIIIEQKPDEFISNKNLEPINTAIYPITDGPSLVKIKLKQYLNIFSNFENMAKEYYSSINEIFKDDNMKIILKYSAISNGGLNKKNNELESLVEIRLQLQSPKLKSLNLEIPNLQESYFNRIYIYDNKNIKKDEFNPKELLKSTEYQNIKIN